MGGTSPDYRRTLTHGDYRATVPHNTPLICSGVVTEKQEDEGRHLVFCDIVMSNEAGDRYVQGTAQVALPTRQPNGDC